MPATEAAPLTPDERNKRRAERDKEIRQADLPESIRLLLQIQAQHGDDELVTFREGHESIRGAIDKQTRAGFILAAFGFVLVLVVIVGALQIGGVNVADTADATKAIAGAAGELSGAASAPAAPSATVAPAAPPGGEEE